MVFVVAFLIFAALSAATWSVSVACFKATYGEDPGPGGGGRPGSAVSGVRRRGRHPERGFVPFPAGYVAGLIIWAVAAYGFLGLPTGRASVLVGYLAAASVVSRLVVLAALGAPSAPSDTVPTALLNNHPPQLGGRHGVPDRRRPDPAILAFF